MFYKILDDSFQKLLLKTIFKNNYQTNPKYSQIDYYLYKNERRENEFKRIEKKLLRLW